MLSLIKDLYPPPPTFTDADLPNLNNKVVIITGAASGVGYELAKMLYKKGATVYIVARNIARCESAIEQLHTEVDRRSSSNDGSLKSMPIDLADLRTVKPAVEEFLRVERRLDVLVHNAGVMEPPVGSKDALGCDLEIGVNCLAPYLLTKLLEPLILQTAKVSLANSVRTVWVVTMLQAGGSPKQGMLFDDTGVPKILTGNMNNYMQSKVGGAFLAAEFARRLGGSGVLSTTVHPGLMKTSLQRHWSAGKKVAMGLMMSKDATYGAYTELFAAFFPGLDSEHNGAHITAWGRVSKLPDNLLQAIKTKAEGGTAIADKFLAYCDKTVGPYS